MKNNYNASTMPIFFFFFRPTQNGKKKFLFFFSLKKKGVKKYKRFFFTTLKFDFMYSTLHYLHYRVFLTPIRLKRGSRSCLINNPDALYVAFSGF